MTANADCPFDPRTITLNTYNICQYIKYFYYNQ